ncbi:alpha/beta hydrolase [Streptococcus halotolerans]|uniref:alpha/beta hydrolase n=1 Tax=Streptococcus halotolerans TaxID=1814128 RepID=UPI001F230C78|nr:alpha/beta hydrolase [Streptococcus halotolerans]
MIVLQNKTYTASPAAKTMAQEAKPVDHSLYFKAKGKTQASLIFFQGALVEEEAYAPLAADLAKERFDVYLLDSPLNLAILSGNRAKQLKDKLAHAPVYLAGHSLGGVIAAQTVEDFSTDTKGLILLASYPSDKTDLSKKDLAVLSVRASQDKVLNQKSYQKAQRRLPKNTSYTTIERGNHAGFGDYGKQAKDGKASISNTKQRQEIVNAIITFIKTSKNDTHLGAVF